MISLKKISLIIIINLFLFNLLASENDKYIEISDSVVSQQLSEINEAILNCYRTQIKTFPLENWSDISLKIEQLRLEEEIYIHELFLRTSSKVELNELSFFFLLIMNYDLGRIIADYTSRVERLVRDEILKVDSNIEKVNKCELSNVESIFYKAKGIVKRPTDEKALEVYNLLYRKYAE